MLHNEARERLVEGCKRTQNAGVIAKVYGVSEWQGYKLAKQKRETGSVALRTSQRGRKPKMSEEDLQRLKAGIEAHPDKTLGELKEELKLPCSESRLSRIVREKPGFRRKKKMIHASEQERPRCVGKVERKHTKPAENNWYFWMRAGLIRTWRRYGRAIGRQRVVDVVSLNTPKTTTVLSATRLDGQFACRAFEGGTTKYRFLEYLREYLLPCLKKKVTSTISRRTIPQAWRNCSALWVPCLSTCLLTDRISIQLKRCGSKMKAILRKSLFSIWTILWKRKTNYKKSIGKEKKD